MVLRVARHTNNIKSIVEFYTQILNLELLGSFENHDNYDGVFLGQKNKDWHLEFTQSNIKANHIFDEDDILVFYPTTKNEYDGMIKNINQNQIKTIKAVNSYWEKNGIMIEDPDGFKIVISHLKIEIE